MESDIPDRIAGRRITVIAVALLTALTVLTAAMLWSVNDLADSRWAEVARARAAGEAAAVLNDAVLDNETQLRDFLLNGTGRDFDAPTAARAAILARSAQLLAAAQGDAALVGRAIRATAASRDRLDDVARIMDLAGRGERQAALAELGAEHSRAALVALRTDLLGIETDAARLRDEGIANAVNAQHRTYVATALTLLLAVIGLAIALLATTRTRQLAHRRAADLDAAIAMLRDGMLAVGRDGRITAGNPDFCRLVGLSPQLCAKGASWQALLDADARQPVPLLTGATSGSREGLQLEIWRAERNDGGRLIMVADVTRRVVAEATSREASRMEAMGQLTGGLAHDFNNLLQIMVGNLDLVARDAPPQAAPRLADAREAALRGAALIRSLLAFARRQPLAPVATDPNRLVADIVEMVRGLIGTSIELRTVLAAGAWPVLVDPVQLQSAILNVAANARDAMPGGGALTIEVANITADPTWAAAAELPPGDYTQFAISDTGIGMSAEVRARAFDPFFTTKDTLGTGLGLAMVYGFVHQSGGHVRLYSELGKGTTVKLMLPRAMSGPATATAVAVAPAAARGRSILLVEDDVWVRESTAAVLTDLGYAVTVAASAVEARARLAARPFDLLLTDVVLTGGIGGPALAREAQVLRPNICVLFMSGYTQTGIVHAGRLDPGVRLLSKPVGREELARAVGVAMVASMKRLAILVVEDEAMIRIATEEMLRGAGHDVVGAASVAEARAAAAITPPDLLLSDVSLPDGDGLQLAAELRGANPRLGVVMASGRAPLTRPDDDLIWLIKPYEDRALLEALARAARSA